MSAEAELESSFVSDLWLHHLVFEYFIVWSYAVPLGKQDSIVCPLFYSRLVMYANEKVQPCVPSASYVTFKLLNLSISFPSDRTVVRSISTDSSDPFNRSGNRTKVVWLPVSLNQNPDLNRYFNLFFIVLCCALLIKIWFSIYEVLAFGYRD